MTSSFAQNDGGGQFWPSWDLKGIFTYLVLANLYFTMNGTHHPRCGPLQAHIQVSQC